MSFNNLALVLHNRGNYKAAEEMNPQVLDTRERVWGPEHPDTLVSFDNLVWMLKDRGKSCVP